MALRKLNVFSIISPSSNSGHQNHLIDYKTKQIEKKEQLLDKICVLLGEFLLWFLI